jgi:hypothetical protein
LLGDPHVSCKTFCPLASIDSRRELKKFPFTGVAGIEGLKVLVFTMG